MRERCPLRVQRSVACLFVSTLYARARLYKLHETTAQDQRLPKSTVKRPYHGLPLSLWPVAVVSRCYT